MSLYHLPVQAELNAANTETLRRIAQALAYGGPKPSDFDSQSFGLAVLELLDTGTECDELRARLDGVEEFSHADHVRLHVDEAEELLSVAGELRKFSQLYAKAQKAKGSKAAELNAKMLRCQERLLSAGETYAARLSGLLEHFASENDIDTDALLESGLET